MTTDEKIKKARRRFSVNMECHGVWDDDSFEKIRRTITHAFSEFNILVDSIDTEMDPVVPPHGYRFADHREDKLLPSDAMFYNELQMSGSWIGGLPCEIERSAVDHLLWAVPE